MMVRITVAIAPLTGLRLALDLGLDQIIHRERRRAFTVQVRPPEEVPLGEAIERITEEVVQPLRESGALGNLYQVGLGGTADRLRETWMGAVISYGAFGQGRVLWQSLF